MHRGRLLAEDELVVPFRHVGDGDERGRDVPQTGAVALAKGGGQLVEAVVQEHQARAIAHVADARPFGVRAMHAIGGVARFGQAIGRPHAGLLAHLDECRAQVPAERPHGFVIARRARESAGAGDVEMLPTRENAPRLAIPLAQIANVLADAAPHCLSRLARRGERLIRRLQIRPCQLLCLKLRRRAGVVHFPKRRWRRVLAIRRYEESSLRCPRTFVVPAGQRLLEKLRHSQGMHVHFINRSLLREVEHLVLRVGEMPRQSGEPSRQLVTRDDAHLARFINGIRSDEQLPRLAMNHPAGTRAAYALGPDLQRHVRQDGEELVIAAPEVVRRVSRAPQLPRPRHRRAESTLHGRSLAFRIGIENREMRIDAGHAERISGVGANGEQKRGSQRGFHRTMILPSDRLFSMSPDD